MKLSAQVAYNTMIQIIGKVISTILGLVAIAIMARYLRETGFGQYTTIITFLSFFGIMADFGLTLITSQMMSQPQANQEKLLNNLFISHGQQTGSKDIRNFDGFIYNFFDLNNK